MSSAATEKILQAVRSARDQARSAERAFDRANDAIQRQASRSIDLFGGSATSQVANIARDARRACDDLYSAYQSLVRVVDEKCRPLLSEQPSLQAVKEVRDLIKWLNDESEIENNFTASLNSRSLGDVASARYVPSMDSKMIQRYWENKYDSWPGRAEELAAQRAAAEERRKRETEQARLREIQRRKEEDERRIAERKLAEEKAVAKAHMDQVRQQCREKVSDFRCALDAALQVRERKLREEVQAEMEKLEAQKQALAATLAGLGIFQGGKKKQCRRELSILSSKLMYLADPQLWQDEMAVLEKKAAQAVADYEKQVMGYLDRRFPYNKRLAKAQQDYERSVSGSGEGVKGLLIEVLHRLGRCTISQIMEQPEMKDMSNQRVNALLRQMITDGTVDRSEYARKAYFSLVDYESAVGERKKKVKVDGMHEYSEDAQTAAKPCPEPPAVQDVL